MKLSKLHEKEQELKEKYKELYSEAFYHQQKEDYEKAIEAYKQIIGIGAHNNIVLNNLASCYYELKQYKDALDIIDIVKKRGFEDPKFYSLLAAIYREMKKYEDALTAYRKVLTLDPNNTQAYFNIGLIFKEQEKFELCLIALKKAHELDVTNTVILHELAGSYQDLNQHEKALKVIEEVLKLDPNKDGIYATKTVALTYLNDAEEGIKMARKALEQDPELAQNHYNYAHMLLIRGEFDQGWKEYEYRHKLPIKISHYNDCKSPVWEGQSLQGKSLLLFFEQGYGDTFQFIRYINLIDKQGGKIILLTQPRLKELFATSFPQIDQIIEPKSVEDSNFPKADYKLSLASFPRVFKTSVETIPNKVPYFFVPEALIEKWGKETKQGKLKVGLVWSGNTSTKYLGKTRSITFDKLAPLFEIPEVMFYGLQVGPGQLELRKYPVPKNFKDLGQPWIDTAAIMKNLDLIVTVDTSLCHLAGGLGCETWTMLPYGTCFRWLLEREDTPWYPTMKLFRQKIPFDWQGVISNVKTALEKRAEER